jgi:NAD(P)-dependent dehydrogenase (short-subunit alcohol dehydrogenase family)
VAAVFAKSPAVICGHLRSPMLPCNDRRMLLDGKSAIVTGAGSGIGRASAIRFAEEGAAVVVADVRLAKAAETAEMIKGSGGQAVAVEADVRRADEVERMIGAAVENFGGLQVLFNNAGTIRPGNAVQLAEEDWHLVMDTNVTSVYLGAKYAVPVMTEGGSIISTASVSGLAGDPSSIVYGASKAAVVNLTRCLAVDHARQGIRVNCICPGAIDTPPVGRMLSGEGAREAAGRTHLLGRIGRPEEIAAAAVWLASDEASFITGQALVVDGGLTAQSHLRNMGDPRPAHRRA